MFGLQITALILCFVEMGYSKNATTTTVEDNAHQLKALKQLIEANINKIYELNKQNANAVDDHGKQVDSSSIAPEQNETDISNSHSIGKRTHLGIERWICSTGMAWKVLGDGFHPRFVKEIVCSQTTCVRGYFSCQPYFYPIRVLAARTSDDDIDLNMPRALRGEWKFSTIDLAVGCECGRAH